MKDKKCSRREFVRATSAVGAAFALPAVTTRHAFAQKKNGKPAILGGEPVRTEPFPAWPEHKKIDEANLMDALRRDEWCRLYGDITTNFENKWAELLGAKHVVGVVNGTNALYASLYTLGVGPGDEVLIPPYTFIATLNAVLQVYALPVFVDTDPDSLLMDATKIEERVTEHTRCIMPVHLGGSVADMDTINRVAKKHSLGVIEDACQAHFAEWRGKRAGGLGDLGCFSFQATKILPCGEGGAIVSNRDDLLDIFHAFHNNGRDRKLGSSKGYHLHGSNLRITEFQAALLLAQLTRFEEICKLRESNAAYFNELIEEIPGLSPARMYAGCTRNTYYMHMLRYDAQHFAGMTTRQFTKALSKEGIPKFSRGYRPLNREPFLETMLNSRAYQNIYSKERLKKYWENNNCPANDRACESTVCMGHRLFLGTRSDIEQIIEAIKKIQTHALDVAKA